jgi:mannose/fructose/N-acetylgalactosamine-specific phosphotransferase system component IIB
LTPSFYVDLIPKHKGKNKQINLVNVKPKQQKAIQHQYCSLSSKRILAAYSLTRKHVALDAKKKKSETRRKIEMWWFTLY